MKNQAQLHPNPQAGEKIAKTGNRPSRRNQTIFTVVLVVLAALLIVYTIDRVSTQSKITGKSDLLPVVSDSISPVEVFGADSGIAGSSGLTAIPKGLLVSAARDPSLWSIFTVLPSLNAASTSPVPQDPWLRFYSQPLPSLIELPTSPMEREPWLQFFSQPLPSLIELPVSPMEREPWLWSYFLPNPSVSTNPGMIPVDLNSIIPWPIDYAAFEAPQKNKFQP